MAVQEKNGKRFWAEVSLKKVVISGQEYVLAVDRDITERKLAEDALRESEERFHYLADATIEALFINKEGICLEVNQAAAEMFGFEDASELVGLFGTDVIAPESHAIVRERMLANVSGTYEVIGIRKDGSRFPVEIKTKQMPYKNEELVRVTAVRDITERKLTEDALRMERDRAQRYLDVAGVMLIALDTDGKVSLINNRGCEILGGKEKDIIGKNWFDSFLLQINRKEVKRVFKSLMAGKIEPVEYYENPVLTRSGEERIIAWHNALLRDDKGRITGILSSGEDITARQQAEEALRESEEIFRVTAQKTGQMVYDYNPATGKIKWEGAVEALTGQTYEDIQSCDVYGWVELVHEEDRKTILDELDIAQQKCSSYDVEYRFRQKNGCFLFVEEHGVFLPDSEGKAVRMLGSLQDITERKQAEEALQESRETYRTLLENLPQNIFYKDNNSVYISCNANFARDLHIQPAEIAGKTDWDFFPKELAEKYRADDSRIIKSGRMADFEEAYIQDGKEVIVYTVKTPVRDGDGKVVGLLGIFWDITERKQLEEERKKASRLESIGVLAGGIAHDFNNILTAVLGNISLAHAFADEDINKAKEILAEAEQAALSAKDLTLQLLTFARGGEPVKKIISISSLISDTARFALRGSNVKSDLQLERDLWPVDADEGQIKQVINNIVINACQAMPRGGLISIQTANLGVGSGDSLPLAEGKYIRTTIADQGIGIADEYLARIFDPYFTTKQKGSGLGLATSYSIVKRHGGHIKVESELNAGSKFHIYLPASMKPVEAKEVKMGAISTAGGRILVMDDEKILCDAVARMLKYLGHEVEVVGDGVEAVRRYGDAKKANRPFDVVILDLTIPGGMGGKETIKQLLELDPDVKTIVSSGYSNDSVMSNFKEYGFSGMVAKPYQIDELKQVLFEVLEK